MRILSSLSAISLPVATWAVKLNYGTDGTLPATGDLVYENGKTMPRSEITVLDSGKHSSVVFGEDETEADLGDLSSVRFFNVDSGVEWNNLGTLTDENQTCFEFHMCSNKPAFTTQLPCLHFPTNLFTHGCDPIADECTLYRQPKFNRYVATSGRQRFVYDTVTRQISNLAGNSVFGEVRECLTLLQHV